MIGQANEKRGMIIGCLTVILALFVIVPMSSMGEEKRTESPNAIEPNPLKSVSYENYGSVQRIAEDEIVVDDRLLKLAENVVYHAPESGGLVSKNIKEGSQIGFNLNDKKEVTDIWILKKK